jgi:deoxyribodipyrimidine photolyase-related protein
MKKLRLILGDQLNLNYSWFQESDSNTTYVLAEMRQETDYVKHHIQKVLAFFLSMRNFYTVIKEDGHQAVYFQITDAENPQDLEKIIGFCIEKYKIEKFEYQLPDEYRLDEQLKTICSNLKIESQAFDSEHFYTSRHELSAFFEGKKLLLMENFYRNMRKKHHILMDGATPLGNQWNFDADNRKKYKGEVPVPSEKNFHANVSEVVAQIKEAGIITFGNIDTHNFSWPTSWEQSLEVLD